MELKKDYTFGKSREEQKLMERIAVIGNGGGGKTTLCLRLQYVLHLPIYEIDKIQFKPGWVRTPLDEVREKHDAILREEQWIIDGWGPWDAIQKRFELADTIILVDFPLRIHLYWAMKRQIQSIFRPRVGGPEGCPLLPMTWQMMKTIYRVHKYYRPELLKRLDSLDTQHTRIIHIHMPKELRYFLSAITKNPPAVSS
jgi:adenylate kinase family enzyme